MLAGDVMAVIEKELDDPGLVHHAETVLIALSEAQRLVSWRFQLVRATVPFVLSVQIPLYHIHLAHPRSIWVLYATHEGNTLWPVPTNSLRLNDPAWAATTGTPEYVYQYGVTRVGFYPVPDVELSVDLTLLVAPLDLVTTGQVFEVPEPYMARVLDVAVGILLITGERAFQQGMARVKRGLDLPQRPRLTERHARDTQE